MGLDFPTFPQRTAIALTILNTASPAQSNGNGAIRLQKCLSERLTPATIPYN
ncbi:MAG: hypothetical protein AAGG51_10445 [Cyanobacteria bacterium P01_G01_bin.54]